MTCRKCLRSVVTSCLRRQLNGAGVLKVFPAFRLEMKALGNPKDKVVLELWVEMLFWGLGILRVIGHYLNEVKVKQSR